MLGEICGRQLDLVFVVLSAVAPMEARAARSTSPTAYPGGTYSPPAATFGTSQDTGVLIRMDDGVTLKADILFPTNQTTGHRAKGPFPVLLTQDIYAGGAGSARTTGSPSYFVQRGYIYIHLNQRGTNGSEGTNDIFGPRTGLDGVEVAYWAANPKNVPGSNGVIGLEGCSALGISQLNTLAQLGRRQREGALDPRTNPIKAVIPNCLSGDFYRDTFFDSSIPSGVFAVGNAGVALTGPSATNPAYNVSWTTMFIDATAGGDQGFYRQFWQDRDRVLHAQDIARTGVPALMWVGWGEGGSIGAQELYAALQNVAGRRPPFSPMVPGQKVSPKYQAIIGDWGHGGGLDQGIQIEWYDTWLKGVNTGLRNARRPLHMKELPSATTTRWVNATHYPMTGAYTRYYLDSANALSRSAPASAGSDQIVWAPGSSVTYTISKGYTQDMTLIGPSALRVWAGSTNSNMQLFAELLDVAPDGAITAITHGTILASRRATNRAKSWAGTDGVPIRPYLTLTHDSYITANTPLQLDIPIQPVTWRLLAGHKLALKLATQSPPEQCASTTKIGAAPTGCLWTAPMLKTLPGGVYTILHDRTHRSVLNVGLVPSSSLVTARSGTTPTSGGVALPQDW